MAPSCTAEENCRLPLPLGYIGPMRCLSLLLGLSFLLTLSGCGGPGGAPGAPESPRPPGTTASSPLGGPGLTTGAGSGSAASTGETAPGWARTPSRHRATSGAWQVHFYDPPLRIFEVVPPPGTEEAIQPPTRIQFFSEGKSQVVLRPEGGERMAFHFPLPEGMSPVPEEDPSRSPIFFPEADVWVFRSGQILRLRWTRQRVPGWLGVTPCFDAAGRRVAISGSLHLPEGWVGVPSGNPIFRVGKDRVYGPFRRVRPGLWTTLEEPDPLALELLPGIEASIAEALGPAPRQIPELVVEGCGACPREEGQPPVPPRGEADALVTWIRLGSPGILRDRPGPLQTQPLKRWIPVEDGDPTATSLVNLYSRALFPTLLMTGVSLLPPPTLSGDLERQIRSWRRRDTSWESRTLTDTVLPGIFFECREMDRKAFDTAVRALVARKRAPLFGDLLAALRKHAPACLTPLELRGLGKTR